MPAPSEARRTSADRAGRRTSADRAGRRVVGSVYVKI
jgi:hypothetical protein